MKSKVIRHYYAASSYMGLDYTYDSPCWSLYAFRDKKERDEFVETTPNTQSVNLATARKISPWLNQYNPEDDQTGYYTYNRYREVIVV